MALMSAALILMACAAVRAQTAYLRRHDDPLVSAPFVNSAIRLGVAGAACFVIAKMLL